MKHIYHAENETVLIRPLQKEDIESLRVWRNDKLLSAYLSEVPFITIQKQEKWYTDYLQDGDTIFWGIIDKSRDTLVGSIALYGFTNDSCSVGRIVIGDPAARGKGFGYGSLLLAIRIAFHELNVKKITLDVHEDNLPAKSIYEKAGFIAVGKHPFAKGGNEIEMQLDYASYCNAFSERVFT